MGHNTILHLGIVNETRINSTMTRRKRTDGPFRPLYGLYGDIFTGDIGDIGDIFTVYGGLRGHDRNFPY